MAKVEFFRDKTGREPIRELLIELKVKAEASKNERIRFEKILQYIRILEEYGTRAGMPYVKKIDEDLWELRPLKDRIFFFYCGSGSAYILLHHFVKKTRKTPAKELARARVNLMELEGRE